MLLTYAAGPLFPTPAFTQFIYLCEDVIGFVFYWVRENAACTLVRAQFHTPPVLVAQEFAHVLTGNNAPRFNGCPAPQCCSSR